MNKAKELAGYLVLLTPPGTQEKIPFYLGENIIGRSDSKADVVVRDFSISQKHARLFVTPQAMTLTDIGSKNGVTINSEGN
jgi:pSer/pThr/pTyr-binding forkhead associated (FHA) protein